MVEGIYQLRDKRKKISTFKDPELRRDASTQDLQRSISRDTINSGALFEIIKDLIRVLTT